MGLDARSFEPIIISIAGTALAVRASAIYPKARLTVHTTDLV